MKGDFSRDTFDPKNHYSRVLMQQGRVQTDADWNEQQAITAYRDETETKDVIGPCGAPVNDAGFGIATDGKTLTISKGRMYVDGILCENDQADSDYFKQPDLPNAPKLLDLFNKAKAPFGIVYLDVWQRHITALDTPQIREVALGGPDTATRAKTIWQVRVLPVQGPNSEDCTRLEKERKDLQAKIAKLQKEFDKTAGSKSKAALKKNLAAAPELDKLKEELARLEAKIAAVCGTVECITPFPEWDTLIAAPTGKLNARTSPPQPTTDECQIPPSAGYTRLENQIYRVEIHQGGDFQTGAVTFKWSRDNGTVTTLVEKISGSQVTVHDVGPDDVLGFANGQFVEVIDDVLELNGVPGQLIQIKDVQAATRVITLASAPTLSFDATRHPKLRRWDSMGAMKVDGTWQALEGGVQVQFAKGTYKTGDYWLIPARTATGDIEWPRDTANAPIPQTRRGIAHHYCRLALVDITNGNLAVTADCRRLFPPLTELPTGQIPPAVQAFHVAEISWRNDDLFDASHLSDPGLQIKFDAPPDPNALNAGAFIVTFEPINPSQVGARMRDIFVLEGTAQMSAKDATVVTWKVKVNANLGSALAQRPSFEPGLEPRVRVRLMGHKLWSRAGNQTLYLDGQVFGKQSTRADGKTPRIDLNLPSGGSARAGDFESWFYMGVQSKTEPPLQVTAVKLIPAEGQTVAVIPQRSKTQLPIQISGVKAVEITFNLPPDGASVIPDSIFVFTMDGRIPGSLSVKDNTAYLDLKYPVPKGSLEVAGSVDNSFKPAATPVKAQDDGTVLDGDYDNTAGGDFILPFYTIG